MKRAAGTVAAAVLGLAGAWAISEYSILIIGIAGIAVAAICFFKDLSDFHRR